MAALFSVAISTSGIFDMLRYQHLTMGWLWASEFGTTDNLEEFEYLYQYSPLHNITNQKYPATFIITGSQNNIVAPVHSYKFAAALQQNQIGQTPILLKSYTNARATLGQTLFKKQEVMADKLSFLMYHLGIIPYNTMEN